MIVDNIMERFDNPWLRIPVAILLGLLASIFDILFHLRGEARFVFFYFFPVFVTFFIFVFERLENYRNIHLAQWGIDAVVVAFSVLRAFYEVPIISGHALFLTFAFITLKRLSSRVLILLVWFQVLYFKLFVLHDPTFFGGFIFGNIAALLWFLVYRRNVISKPVEIQ